MMCALPPSFNFSSPNQRRISAPTTIEHCSKRALSIVKYSKALFLLMSRMKREVGSIVAIICWTFMSFSIHTGSWCILQLLSPDPEFLLSIHSAVQQLGLFRCCAIEVLSPQLAMTTWSQTFQMAHSLPDMSSLGSLISSDVVVLMMMNICMSFVRFLVIKAQGSQPVEVHSVLDRVSH